MIRIHIAACTDKGARQSNEDDLRFGSARNGWYAVLADGAGGHRAGAEAAQRAVQRVQGMLCDDAVAFSPANLTQIVQLAHAELVNNQSGGDATNRMHCTLVVLWIDPESEHVLWTHVGDSRLYRIRHGRVDVMTSDDSVVQHMLQTGLINAEQALNHPKKNQLLAALGIEGELEPHTVVRPVDLKEGDAFLLCSDGWWEHFDHALLVRSLVQALTPQDWLDAMQAQVRAQNKPRQDNYSALAVWAGNPAEVTQPGAEDTQPRGRPS